MPNYRKKIEELAVQAEKLAQFLDDTPSHDKAVRTALDKLEGELQDAADAQQEAGEEAEEYYDDEEEDTPDDAA